MPEFSFHYKTWKKSVDSGTGTWYITALMLQFQIKKVQHQHDILINLQEAVMYNTIKWSEGLGWGWMEEWAYLLTQRKLYFLLKYRKHFSAIVSTWSRNSFFFFLKWTNCSKIIISSFLHFVQFVDLC